MKKFWIYSRIFIICVVGMCFLFSCSRNEKKQFILLDQFREKKLQNIEEWKAFNESSAKFQEYLRTPKGDYETLCKQAESLLKDCLNKIENVKRLKNKELITDTEIEAMVDYFAFYLKHTRDSQIAFSVDKKSGEKKKAYFDERAYRFLKERQSLIINLSRQNNWINWVKNDYVIGFIKPQVDAMQDITLDTLKYWEKPVSMEEVARIKGEMTILIDGIR